VQGAFDSFVFFFYSNLKLEATTVVRADLDRVDSRQIRTVVTPAYDLTLLYLFRLLGLVFFY
jgi:hypothetical protein